MKISKNRLIRRSSAVEFILIENTVAEGVVDRFIMSSRHSNEKVAIIKKNHTINCAGSILIS